MKKLLVTGGAGFIGANFVHYWIKTYPNDEVVVIDALTYAGNISNLESVKDSDKFTFVKGDICDLNLIEKLITQHQIDTVVHFAAESHVDRSITGPDSFIETNIIGTYTLLKAAKKCWLDEPELRGEAQKEHRFHHVSTDEVYGTLTLEEPAFKETTAYAPNSPYSASKASSDHLVRAYHHTYGLNVSTSNCSNNYGPLHFPEKLIPLVVTNILLNKDLPIYGDGMQIRDWLYVEDHARGIDLVLKKGVNGETYNIGGNNEWANINIVKEICKIINLRFQQNIEFHNKYSEAVEAIKNNSDSLIVHVTDRPGHDQRYAIDATKTYRDLGFEPAETFASGIEKTIDWYLNNDKWWKSILDGTYQQSNEECFD